jgi:hypothetical protein
MPTGDYEITVGIHQAGNESYLQAYDINGRSIGTEVTITRVLIEKNKASFTANDMIRREPFTAFFADMQEMRLMGYYPYRASATAGDLVQIGLYWRARAKPQGDYSVVVQLRDSSGQVVVEQIGRPASGTYPTQNWDAGEVLLDWHDFLIPALVTPGDYSIVVGLRDSKTDANLGESVIGSLEILAPK